MSDEGDFDIDRQSDARLFRVRAREERRRRRGAGSERARRIHAEMAEHYDSVAALLDTKPGRASRSLASSLRAMLAQLFPN